MGKQARRRAAASSPVQTTEPVPVVGAREPCPCGSGRRYKACHGRDAARAAEPMVARPFAGLPGECDWVALREFVPAATAPVRLREGTDRALTITTVLPMAWPGLVRADGSTYIGLQVPGGSGDASRDAAFAIERALATEPGNPLPPVGLPGPGPRLQDLLDLDAPFEVTLHEGFDFWVEGAEQTPDVVASLERANASVVPTQRLTGVEAAYWCRIGSRAHLRWVMPHDEDALIDAQARLHAAGADSLGEGTRFVGSFRADGLLVPVWDLPVELAAEALEAPAVAFAQRLAEALDDTSPLTDAQRRARNGLRNRQLTLR
ncbi:MAG TPA: DUF5926 family protein [Actinomycetes bacterium]|nr:DUF5926 family protein [Actinomycetes bacterium]